MEKRFGITLLIVAFSLLLLTLLAQTLNFASASINQHVTTLDSVDLNGPYDGVVGVEYSFTAVVSPTNATTPITYVWEAAGETVTRTGGLSDTYSVIWAESGLQPITVTTTNIEGSVAQNQFLNILPNPERIPQLYGGPFGIYPSQARAIVSTINPSVDGMHSCTSFGDPFSPLNSPWQPGVYLYRYLIQIPAAYPFDEVRVELFDPDSVNQSENTFTIYRTQAAIAEGLAPTFSDSCADDQMAPCKIETGELDLALAGVLDYEQVNPNWIVRADRNRGGGSPPGNGTCASHAGYDPAYNTRTLYQLYYMHQIGDELPQYTLLAAYTGQTGDGTRDSGDHQTDMHWVSPGAPVSFDQVASVPVDPGSATSFQINLTTDVPNILTDPKTGDRYLGLEIAGLDGASLNSFGVWAGPPIYTSTIPSEVNARNLYLLNNPEEHNSFGVTIYARSHVVQEWNLGGHTAVIPLTYLGQEAAGQDAFISLFDSDINSTPPITFFVDSIPKDEWALPFAVPGQPDPDGETGRCAPGNCNNQWVNPPYKITLPQDFPGGRLMVAYNGGILDVIAWQFNASGRLIMDGPMNGVRDETYSFAADAIYFLGSNTVTYTWNIEGYDPITQVSGITDSLTISWPLTGTKMMTVTAENGLSTPFPIPNTIVGYHQIVIEDPPEAPTAVTITGPSQGMTNTLYAFTATVAPLSTTTPVTYVWEIEGQGLVTHTGDISDTVSLMWEMDGEYELQVTAVNAAGNPVTDTHTLMIGLDEKLLFLPVILQETIPLN